MKKFIKLYILTCQKLPEKKIQISFENPNLVRRLLRKNKIEWLNGEYHIDVINLLQLLEENEIRYYVTKGKEIIQNLKTQQCIVEILRLLNKGLPIEEDNRLMCEYTRLTGKVI